MDTTGKKMTRPQCFDGREWKEKIFTRRGIHGITAVWVVDKEEKMAADKARSGLERQVEALLAK